MNKTELTTELRDRADLTWDQAHLAVNTVFDVIEETLVIPDSVVVITGFGKFSSRVRAARTARNPQSGELVEVPAKTVVSFKAGKSLKTALNG